MLLRLEAEFTMLVGHKYNFCLNLPQFQITTLQKSTQNQNSPNYQFPIDAIDFHAGLGAWVIGRRSETFNEKFNWIQFSREVFEDLSAFPCKFRERVINEVLASDHRGIEVVKTFV